jgi:hypothetical protein
VIGPLGLQEWQGFLKETQKWCSCLPEETPVRKTQEGAASSHHHTTFGTGEGWFEEQMSWCENPNGLVL